MASLMAWQFSRAEGADDAPQTRGLRPGEGNRPIGTNLSADQEARLREAFGQEEG
jgi:hypothetical protein